jgi:hypothetical protein
MRDGYRERAKREFEGWAGVEKGTKTKAIRLLQPLAEALLKLKAQRTKIIDVQKACFTRIVYNKGFDFSDFSDFSDLFSRFTIASARKILYYIQSL